MKIYFETSAVIDVALATDREGYPDWPICEEKSSHEEEVQYLKELLFEEKRYKLATSVRQKLAHLINTPECVVSHLVMFEAYEWIVEERFRNDASEAMLAKFVRSFSRKQVGDFMLKLYSSTTSSEQADNLFQGIIRPFTQDNLAGLIIEDCAIQLDYTTYQLIEKYAVFQIGLADVLHLAAARSLGCQMFFTLDEDYNRLSQIIQDDFGIRVLFKDAVLAHL